VKPKKVAVFSDSGQNTASGFFKKHFRFAPCFSPIGERVNHNKL